MPICLVSVLYDFVRFSWFLGHDFFSFLYRRAFRCQYFTKFLQFLVKALRFTLFLRNHFYYFYHVPSILVFIVLPRTYVVPQTGCYSNF